MCVLCVQCIVLHVCELCGVFVCNVMCVCEVCGVCVSLSIYVHVKGGSYRAWVGETYIGHLV